MIDLDLDVAKQLADRWVDQAQRLESVSEQDYEEGYAHGLRRAAVELGTLVAALRDLEVDERIPERDR